MFEYGWFRFLAASAMLAGWGVVELVSRLAAWRSRPPRVRRPAGSHLLGFFSMLVFYGLLGRDGRSVAGGTGNWIGVLLCGLFMVLRFALRRRDGPIRHGDLLARALFFAALPLVVGSPRSLIALTLPQGLIAAYEARQRGVSQITP